MSEKKYSKEEIQAAADYISLMVNPIILPGLIHLEVLEHSLKRFKEMKSTIVSAAVIIGPGYLVKEKELAYKIKRTEAIVNLLKTYKESQKEIDEIENLRNGQEKINRMFRL